MCNWDRSHHIGLRIWIAGSRPMPHSAAIGVDVDFGRIVLVEDHAMSPLEVISIQPSPMLPGVRRTIGC